MMDLYRLVLLLVVIYMSCQTGQCLENGNILDQIVRIVWDPTGLVYIWTGLDQFINVVSSWRELALSLLTLPFRQTGKFGDHIRINGRDRALGQIKRRPIAYHLNRVAHTKKDFMSNSINKHKFQFSQLYHPEKMISRKIAHNFPKTPEYQRPYFPNNVISDNTNHQFRWMMKSKLKQNKLKQTFPLMKNMKRPSFHHNSMLQGPDEDMQRALMDIMMSYEMDNELIPTEPHEKLKVLLYLLKELKPPDIDSFHHG